MSDHIKTLNGAGTSDRINNLHNNIFKEEENPALDYPFTEAKFVKL